MLSSPCLSALPHHWLKVTGTRDQGLKSLKPQAYENVPVHGCHGHFVIVVGSWLTQSFQVGPWSTGQMACLEVLHPLSCPARSASWLFLSSLSHITKLWKLRRNISRTPKFVSSQQKYACPRIPINCHLKVGQALDLELLKLWSLMLTPGVGVKPEMNCWHSVGVRESEYREE